MTERRTGQLRLARLAILRLRLDREMDERIEGLRKLLGQRADLTRSMRQEAQGIGLTLDGDYFDEARYQELEGLLPAWFADQSEGWLKRFFGKREGAAPRIVKANFVTIRETLASPNLYRKGQAVHLTVEEIKSLGAATGPASSLSGAGQ